MKFTLIVTLDPEKAPAAGSAKEREFVSAFVAFNADIEAPGVYLAGEPLQSVESATTVRMKSGETPHYGWSVRRDERADRRVLPRPVR